MFSSFYQLLKRNSSAATSVKGSEFLQASVQKQKFIGSPLFNVLLMVMLMLTISGLFRFLEWRRLNAQTQIKLNETETPENSEKSAYINNVRQPEIFGGEVFDTSRRLRETGALGFAVCLSILDEAKTRRQIPGSINALINSVTARRLLPPGLEVAGGEIHSATSKIYLRFNPAQMRIEFISVPDEPRFGPALLLRFPLTSPDGKNIGYFQSTAVSGINLPAPFAPVDEIIRSGWTLEVWRGSNLSDDGTDFAKKLADEQKLWKEFAPDSSDLPAR